MTSYRVIEQEHRILSRYLVQKKTWLGWKTLAKYDEGQRSVALADANARTFGAKVIWTSEEAKP
jgi:oligoendopeptidase F